MQPLMPCVIIFYWNVLFVDHNIFCYYEFLQKFLEHDFLLEKLSRQAPIYIVMEGSEPPFFTRFFTWDSEKSAVSDLV